jgi:Na+:H+ antiporter, NhaA family
MMPSTKPATPIELITSPFVRFARMEAAGGIVLLAGTILALVWANSPWQHSYHDLLETQVSIGVGNFVVTENRHEWINDGLMSLFFFLVGLEIKREILVGELSSMRRAIFPFIAALGGMVVPAAIYVAITSGTGVERGWAVPISTDIAFALGLLTFLGRRVPLSLKVFVAALAIVDDIFAVVVIALFYTNEIHWGSLAIGMVCIAMSAVANVLGVRKPIVYAAIGLVAWVAVLSSGVHATIAGILLAFTIPARSFLEKDDFLAESRTLLDKLQVAEPNSFEEHSIIHTLEEDLELVQSPLHRIEQRLQPWVSFLVVPLFALANAGVNVRANLQGAFTHHLTWGVFFGLVVGKPLGVFIFSYLAIKLKIAAELENVSWTQVLGAGCLCGIGFTMSLFVSTLAFDDEAVLSISKIGILLASIVSGIAGTILLTRFAPKSAWEK